MDVNSRYYEDCVLIQQAFAENGYDITLDDAFKFWSDRSDCMAAGWLILGTDLDGIFEEVMKYSDAGYILEKRKEVKEITDEIREMFGPLIDVKGKEKMETLIQKIIEISQE